jgi:hypothetical protein
LSRGQSASSWTACWAGPGHSFPLPAHPDCYECKVRLHCDQSHCTRENTLNIPSIDCLLIMYLCTLPWPPLPFSAPSPAVASVPATSLGIRVKQGQPVTAKAVDGSLAKKCTVLLSEASSRHDERRNIARLSRNSRIPCWTCKIRTKSCDITSFAVTAVVDMPPTPLSASQRHACVYCAEDAHLDIARHCAADQPILGQCRTSVNLPKSHLSNPLYSAMRQWMVEAVPAS